MDAAGKIINKTADLAALRQRIRQLERMGGSLGPESDRRPRGLPLLAPIDRLWPEGGLPLGCLHEARGDGLAGGGALTAFAGAIAGRLSRDGGMVLWCGKDSDANGTCFYAPGLAQTGLAASKLLVLTAASDAALLAAMEEGLGHPLLSCVVGEIVHLSLTASRRLQLAAEKSGITALVLRAPKRGPKKTDSEPIAAVGRWRIGVLPSAPHAIPEAGRARWRLELLHSRIGATGEWIVEAPDAQGYLRLSSPLADGFAQAPLAAGGHLATG